MSTIPEIDDTPKGAVAKENEWKAQVRNFHFHFMKSLQTMANQMIDTSVMNKKIKKEKNF